MILPVYLYGMPVLRKEAEEIAADYPKMKELIQNMFETMSRAEGIGLAAPQVGLAIRLFVVDLEPLAQDHPEFKGFKKVLINPVIVDESDEIVVQEEGCLSIPGLSERVPRKQWVRVRYCDENFVEHEETFTDFTARVIQHEYDHLNGKLFIDSISPIRKQLIKGKLNTIVKGKSSCGYRHRSA